MINDGFTQNASDISSLNTAYTQTTITKNGNYYASANLLKSANVKSLVIAFSSSTVFDLLPKGTYTTVGQIDDSDFYPSFNTYRSTYQAVGGNVTSLEVGIKTDGSIVAYNYESTRPSANMTITYI